MNKKRETAYSAELIDSAAVVVGFSIHGLAIARSLARLGIRVHALTADRTLATSATRYATVHYCPGVDSVSIVDKLRDFATSTLGASRAVLFPTNDNMVRSIGRNWQELEPFYSLSWATCRKLVLELQLKDSLASHCERAGVPYPRSETVNSLEECRRWPYDLSSSCLVIKPVRPLSAFKAVITSSVADLERLVVQYPNDLPFIVQEYVDGKDDELYFCSMYLKDGDEIFAFTGRKLRALPEGTGQGTIMTSEPNEELIQLSRKFLSGLQISGPVAIEYKRDHKGRFWLIEPNVGRTEYCVDLLIQSGINVPQFEYFHALGKWSSQMCHIPRLGKRTWYDTEREPFCFIGHMVDSKRINSPGKAVFPYFGHSDTRPLFRAFGIATRRLATRAVRKMTRRQDRIAL